MNQLWMKLIVFKMNNINNSNSYKVKSQTTILIIQIITYNLQILLLNLWKGILLRIIRVFPTRLEGHQKHLILKFQIYAYNSKLIWMPFSKSAQIINVFQINLWDPSTTWTVITVTPNSALEIQAPKMVSSIRLKPQLHNMKFSNNLVFIH